MYVVSPTTAGFDFCHFIAGAQFFAQQRGFKSFDLLLLREDPLIAQVEREWASQDTDFLDWRFHNLIMPLAFLAVGVDDISVTSVNGDWSSQLANSHVFPEGLAQGYIPEWSTPNTYGWRLCDEFSCFSATTSAAHVVAQWLAAHQVHEPFVVINLRDRVKDATRNSNYAEWIKFANAVTDDGYSVVIVPDTGKAWATLPGDSRFRVFREAAFNVDLRLALYELSHCSFFYSNGPAALAMLDSSVNFVVLFPLLQEATYANASTYRSVGLEVGSDAFRWVKGIGVAHWTEDACNELVAAFRKFEDRWAERERGSADFPNPPHVAGREQ